MAYNTESLTKLEALKELAAKVKSDYATKAELAEVQEKVEDITSTGGEPNVIESVKVNGAALQVTDKAVDITVPNKVGDLENDSGYQTGTEVAQAIQSAIAATGHASFQVVGSVPDAESAAENVFYLVMNSETGYYDIYALVSGSVVRLDDTSVDLANYVEKEEGKGLSSNDYTDEDKAKLDGIEIATIAEVQEMLDEVFSASDDG